MHLLVRYLGTVAAVVVTVYLVPGISAPGGWASVFILALVWSAISCVIKPVLQLLALPISILTFGLFALIINALLFWLAAVIVPGFVVANFWSAFLGAIVLSILNGIIHLALTDKK